jgi:DNA-directed RNA polymerase specialized sigma24 family protein
MVVSGRGTSPLAEETLGSVYEWARKALRLRGVAGPEAEDLAQDVVLWLLRNPEHAHVLSERWLSGVVRNFILRHRRSSARRKVCEGTWLRLTAEARRTPAQCADLSIALDQLEPLLKHLERCLLSELRSGSTWVEAAAKVGVPPGSRDWLRKRMSSHVREAFTSKRPAERRGDGA